MPLIEIKTIAEEYEKIIGTMVLKSCLQRKPYLFLCFDELENTMFVPKLM
jgi:hypothetical protein